MNPPPPWAELPPSVIDRVRPDLPLVVDEVIEAVGREVPAYQRPLEGDFGRGLRAGVEAALGHFLDLLGTTQPAVAGSRRETYVALGRGELQAGRSLEALLAAYRVGARVAFRRFADLARRAGLEADLLVPLAVATFAYIDELSTASIEGFTAEQYARVGERDRMRADLVATILSGTADPATVADSATLAGWELPERLVAVLVDAEHADGLTGALGPGAILAPDPAGEALIALVGAPRRATDQVSFDRRLAGRQAVVGTDVEWPNAATSLALARLAARLVARGVLTGDPVHVDDHLVDLVVHRDPVLTSILAERLLAPFTELRPATRDRLTETLLSWLRHRGERQRVADELHLHPQTIAYRVGQLRTLLGSALDDADQRLALELALRAARP